MTLFTFGYEGLAIDAFVGRLQAAGIGTVLDVRELPLSRKPGFSKAALAEALRRAGIGYAHLPALGCPKAIRHRYRVDRDWPGYVDAFGAHLAAQKEAVAALARQAAATRVCLVCFEADFNRCHRSLVAREVGRDGDLEIVHLTATGEILDAHRREVLDPAGEGSRQRG
jgi:uncharacterized protein (DUF488 family)